MRKTKAFWTGISGAILFISTTVIGGFLYPDYSHVSQFISELYAVDAPHDDYLRFFGYIPSGFLLLLFSIFAIMETSKSIVKIIGFLGMGIGYGFGTIICGFFNCDTECNPLFINPSLSQIIHNFTGFITYCVTPISLFLIAISARKWKNGLWFSNSTFILSFISFCFVGLLNANFHSPYKGFMQRVIEGSILVWVLLCACYLSKNNRIY